MKKCPYCAEEIQDDAIKCKHCGEWLSPPTANISGNVTDIFQPGIKAKEAHSVLHRTAKDSQKSKGCKRCEDCDIEFSESEFSRNPYVCNTCVEKKLKTEPPKNMEETNYKEIPDAKNMENSNLFGVRGWLWLLVVLFMIIGPLVGFGRIYGEFYDASKQFPDLADNPQWQMYEYVTWLIFAASAGISISAGYRLWKIHFRESVRFAILALWLAGPLGNVLHHMSVFFIFNVTVNAAFAAETIGSIIGPCIFAGIWTAYLKRSARVKNTYTDYYIQANEGKL